MIAHVLPDEERALLLQGIEAQKWANNWPKDRTIEVFPSVYTNPRYSHWLPKITSKLHKVYLDHSGDKYGQINTDFDMLLNLAGYPMNPLGVPHQIERSGNPSDDLLRIHKIICSKFTEGWTEGLSLSIAKMSQSGPPMYSHDLDYKASLFKWWIEKFDHILDSWVKRGVIGLMENHIFPFFAVGRRYQYDSMKEVVYNSLGDIIKVTPKTRNAATESGSVTASNKKLPPDFNSFVFRQRAREVWGMSGSFNYAWQSVIQGYRDYYSHRYAKIVHHVSVNDSITSFPENGVVASFDFAEFDHSISAPFQHTWINVLEERGVDPRLCSIRRGIISAPVIFHGGKLMDRNIYMLGGLQLGDKQYDYGVQSGIADVADIDKTVGIAVPLCIALRCGILKNEDEIDAVLEDQHPLFRLRNMGDDTVMWFVNQDTLEAFSTECSKMKEFKVELDKTTVFLGHSIVEQGGSRIALPNIARGVANILVPERSISHRLKQGVPRAFWAYGITERNKHYRVHPHWDNVWDLTIQSCSDFYKKNIEREIVQRAIEQQEEANKLYPQLSVYDMMFLQNPSYINYRLNPSDITPKVMEGHYLTIPADEVEKLTKQVFRRA